MKDQFWLDKAYYGWGIPVFVLDKQNRVLYQKWETAIPVNRDAAEEIRKKWKETGIPSVWYETGNIVHMGFEKEDEILCLFGPISFGNISKAQARDYQFYHKWKNSKAALCHISFEQMVSCLSIMYAVLTGKKISEEVLIKQMGNIQGEEEDAWNFMDDYAVFYGYEQEQSFLEEFKQGEMRITEKNFFDDVECLDLISPLARQNYIKNSEYAVVSAISIMRKAAIEAGVPEEFCYRMNFQYLRRLTKCMSTPEMMRVYADAANELGKKIKEIKGRGNIGELQEQCKRYVAGNIRRKFTMKEMADELGYHPGYLSKIFSQREGVSLQKYVLKERLHLAANILKNSNEKIGVISDYLCFHSQSYMTEQFVKEYGMTPTEYRKKNKL